MGGHAYGGACDDRCVERVPVVVVCVEWWCGDNARSPRWFDWRVRGVWFGCGRVEGESMRPTYKLVS